MIRINDDWVILTDDYNYAIARDAHRTRKTRDGKGTEPAYTVRGYYGSLPEALNRLGREIVDEKLKCSGKAEMTLGEAVRIIQDCTAEWKRLVEEITT